MNDQTQAAREDLAFLRGLVEDRGPLPGALGRHFAVIGVLYGLNVSAVWAGEIGLIPFPGDDGFSGWLPATILYVPYSLYLSYKARGTRPGPTVKAFAFAWASMVLMTGTIVASIVVAGLVTRSGAYLALWPALAVALYGGAWSIVSMVRRNLGDFLVAGGCFLSAILCAALVERPERYLVLGLAILFFLGGQGIRIMLADKARA